MPTIETPEQAAFLDAIDDAVDEHALLAHPFYRAWNAGKIDKPVLQEYAKQYFAQVLAFPTYVSAVHSQCDDLRARQLLLENLVEEEHGDENHPELWLRFAEGLGVSRDEVRGAALLPSTVESVRRLRAIARSDDWGDGLAALYAYESQIPEIARTKREGLQRFYGIDDPRALSFFTVHEVADVAHRDQERALLLERGRSADERGRRVRAAGQAARALWGFLDGIVDAYGPVDATA